MMLEKLVLSKHCTHYQTYIYIHIYAYLKKALSGVYIKKLNTNGYKNF